MKKNYLLKGLGFLLILVVIVQVRHFVWFSLLPSSTPSIVENDGKITYSKPHQEGDEHTHRITQTSASSNYFQLPTVGEYSKCFSKLVQHVPTPFPVERVYNSTEHLDIEANQVSECQTFKEDILYSTPLEGKGIQTPTNITSLDMAELWQDFYPSEVRVVMTPNMLKLSDDERKQKLEHLAPVIENPQVQETDFEEYFRENYITFKLMSAIRDPLNSILDRWKRDMNNMNFVLNPHKFNENQKEDHLPIWMRAYRRTYPLSTVLKGLCQVNNIEQTILFVTIDGDQFLPVIEELLKYECVKIRIYFHSFSHTSEHFVKDKEMLEQARSSVSFKLFSHATYGLYLCLIKYKYPYVITIEDDIRPLPDFYNFHRSLYRFTLNESSPFLSVLVIAGGVNHNCNFISSALYQAGIIKNMPFDSLGLKHQVCTIDDVDHVVSEAYHMIWGSGISFRLFRRMWFTWFQLPNRLNFFLGTLLRDLRKSHERNLMPCSNRAEQIANSGVNGGNHGNVRFWQLAAPFASKRQVQDDVKGWSYFGRQYTMMNVDGFSTDYVES